MTRALTAATLLALIVWGCQAPPPTPPAPAGTEAPASDATPLAQPPTPAATPAPPSAPVGTVGIPALRPAATPAAPARPTRTEVTVPTGTELAVELLTSLSTKSTEVETPIAGRLRMAVEVGDRVVIPEGSAMAGAVTASERPGKVKGRGTLSVRFTSVTVGGERLPLRSSAITFHGKDERKTDAVKIGGGAGIGAIVGGIIGGGDGAAKGAAIGGAAGTGVVLATRGQDVELPSGTTLSTETIAPLTLTLLR